MASIFIAKQRSSYEHDEDIAWTPVSHHTSLTGAARAIADDVRERSSQNAPGVVTDVIHAAVVSDAVQYLGFNARDGVFGDPIVPGAARTWVDRIYEIEEAPLLD